MSTSQRPPGRARVSPIGYHQSAAQNRWGHVSSWRSPICAAASSAGSPGRRIQGAPRPTPQARANPHRSAHQHGRYEATVSRHHRRIIGCDSPAREEHRPQVRTSRHDQTGSPRRTLMASRRKDPSRHPKIGMDRTSQGAAFPGHDLPGAAIGGASEVPATLPNDHFPCQKLDVLPRFKNREKPG